LTYLYICGDGTKAKTASFLHFSGITYEQSRGTCARTTAIAGTQMNVNPVSKALRIESV
jgi:hypothetical protein